MDRLGELFEIVVEHEKKFARSFSLIPSENVISPFTRLAFFSDAFSRYFFDEKEVFGRWSFQGGSIAGQIQTKIVTPLLQRLGQARYVDVRPVSGLTGMTVALAAFGGGLGEKILSVPVGKGGHPDTQFIARKFGYVPLDIPFSDWATPDFDRLGTMIAEEKPSLIYVDHATSLFPLDLLELARLARSAAVRKIHIHVDTSHVNGLVWGGVLANPLACGADSYGGSTHKTFPGPHKAVLLTNDSEVADRLTATTVNMVSHHHLSSIIALAITLIEFDECGGSAYAHQIIKNSQAFARSLSDSGFDVQGMARGFTGNHQVWMRAPERFDAYAAGAALFEAGFVVNPYNPLPSLGGAGIRMGVNEPTRLGCKEEHMQQFALFFERLLRGSEPPSTIAGEVASYRSQFDVRYCYDPADLNQRWMSVINEFHDRRASFFKETVRR